MRSKPQSRPTIGVIGGSGLYEMEGLTRVQEVRVTTPFGRPSDAMIVGDLEGARVAFLSRHGRGHQMSPSEINYRANIYALKKIGVERVVSVSAVGSMKESLQPGEVVIPDQFVDQTKRRAGTFLKVGLSRMLPWRIQSARTSLRSWSWRFVTVEERCTAAAAICALRGPNFRPGRSR